MNSVNISSVKASLPSLKPRGQQRSESKVSKLPSLQPNLPGFSNPSLLNSKNGVTTSLRGVSDRSCQWSSRDVFKTSSRPK